MTRYDVLIVGGGHAGAQAAIALRQQGFSGSIAIFGAEPELPYERPPLSKDYLAGVRPFERLLLRPPAFWADRSVAIFTGRRVTALDAAAHRVTTELGEAIGYGQLIWATGGEPRALACAGHALTGVHSLRTRADADRLIIALPTIARVVVIGGGYIGLEAAAALVKAGKRVTLVEAMDRVLARVAGVAVSRFYEAEHRGRGVDVRLSANVERIEGEGFVTGVRLAGGETLPCEAVIVGIGIVPAVGPLLAAGAAGGNGVAVDAACRTSLVDVFAIGDVALHANRYADGSIVRLESVQNANDQATVVARAITGQTAVYDALPWFWSNQYDLKLQTVGLAAGHDMVVLRGAPERRSFSAVYLRGSRVIALDCINATKDFVQGRTLVAHGACVNRARLADAQVSLKDLWDAPEVRAAAPTG